MKWNKYPGLYLIFTTVRKIHKTGGHIDAQTMYVLAK